VLVDSEYEEVPGPHRSSLRLELVTVLRGRFCFHLGAGVRCGGGGTFTITKGDTRTLELSLGLTTPLPLSPSPGFTARVERTHTFAQQIGPWRLGDCDSIFPVLCYDGAEVRIYRTRRPIRRFELSAFTETFDPGGDPGWAHPNILRNDPLCDCHNAARATVIESPPVKTPERVPATRILRPIAVIAIFGIDGGPDDPESAAAEVLEVITDVLIADDDDDERPAGDRVTAGIARVDGTVVWLDRTGTSEGPNLALLPWGVASVARNLLTFEQDLVPLIAIGAPVDAAYCDLTIVAASSGQDELREIAHEHVAVTSNEWMSVVWYEADLSELPKQSTGYVQMEMRDAGDTAIGYPLREPFIVDPLVTVRSPQPA
jgi:hypothetical protein